MSKRVVAVIQARMGSSRLPGKVLLPLRNRPVLEWVVRAARDAGHVDDIVVATSTEIEDDAIVAACDELAVATCRGSETDVLSRFVLAADVTDADAIVRLTADCPLLDPALIDQVISTWRLDPDLDYVSTFLTRSFPRGLDVELATRSALELASESAFGYDRVHVTSYLYKPDSAFERCGLAVAPDQSDLRVTLDVGADYELLSRLALQLPDRPPSWRQVVELLRRSPSLAAINADVEQKRIEDG